MKYAFNYDTKKFKYLNQIDEINVRFRESDTTLFDFMKLHSNQRVNIFIEDAEMRCLDIFDAIANEAPDLDFALKLTNYKDEKAKTLFQEIKDKYPSLKVFFNKIITDWDELNGYLSLGVSDVYVAENLCFEIKRVAEIAHARGARVRIFPNVAQSSWKETPPLKKFFVRPEDVPFYETTVDVMDFFGDAKKIATYYKIYAIDKKWFGNLNEIIIDLNEDVDSRCLLPNFSNRRLNCGKKCMKDFPCDICTAQLELAHTLSDKNLTIKELQVPKSTTTIDNN